MANANMTAFGKSASPIKCLRIPDLTELLGVGKMTIYRMMDAEDNPFPRPIKAGNASIWRERDVIAWLDRQQKKAV